MIALGGVGTAKNITVDAVSHNAQVVLDVDGYYIPPLAGTFNSTGGLVAGSGRLAPSAHSGTGYYVLQADRDLNGCSVTVSSYYFSYNASGYVSGSIVYVLLTTTDGSPVDYYFQVIVRC